MLARIAKVSDCLSPSDLARVGKVSDHKHVEILTPKQILQRLPIALTKSR